MKAFAKQLIAMEVEEASLRETLIEQGELGAGYHPTLRALHEAQADITAETIEKLGWPTLKIIGEDAYDALFMVALNAISRPAWMRRAYAGFSQAKDNMAPGYAAYLLDRIAYFERRPQQYATQWDVTVEGETVLWTLDDAASLNQKRARAGLDTFEELDFALVELDLGQGLKRIMGQYQFLYEVGWLSPTDNQLMRLLRVLSGYTSGGLMGATYSKGHYEGNLADRKGPIDMVMPLQHKEAFEEFLALQGHTIVTKGLKHGLYALKDDLGYVELQVNYTPFSEHEEGWWMDGLDMLLRDAQQHTINGWLLSQASLPKALRL